jgi:glycerol-3-phosphate dehydrogenase
LAREIRAPLLKLRFTFAVSSSEVLQISRDHGSEDITAIISGITLPENVVAVPDVMESVTDADILVWVLPHQVCGKVETYVAKAR